MTTGTSLLSFVTCASCDVTLESNLLASPCLADLAHQVVVIKNCPSTRMGSILASHGWRPNGSSEFIKILASGGMGPMHRRTTRRSRATVRADRCCRCLRRRPGDRAARRISPLAAGPLVGLLIADACSATDRSYPHGSQRLMSCC